MRGLWSPREEAAVQEFLALQLLGSVDAMERQLESILFGVEVDELMFTIDLYDPAERCAALERIQALFN